MSRGWNEKTNGPRHDTQITMRWSDGVVMFDITGYFTEDSEPLLDAVYEEASALGGNRLLLNFDGHGLITSAGYGLIIKFLRKIREKGQSLRIAQPSERARRMFQIMGLAHAVPISASEQEALIAFEQENGGS